MLDNNYYKQEKYYTEVRGKNSLSDILTEKHQKHGGRVDYILNKISNIPVHQGKKLQWLDIGCGTAPIARLIKLKGFDSFIKTTSLDFSNTGILLAKQMGGVDLDYLLAEAEMIPLPNSVEDILSLHDLLEHVPDPEKILVESYRILKKGGLLHAVVPNPYPADNNVLSDIYLSDPTHIVPPVVGIDYFKKIMPKIGFVNTEIITRGFSESEKYFNEQKEELFAPKGGAHIYITSYKNK